MRKKGGKRDNMPYIIARIWPFRHRYQITIKVIIKIVDFHILVFAMVENFLSVKLSSCVPLFLILVRMRTFLTYISKRPKLMTFMISYNLTNMCMQ